MVNHKNIFSAQLVTILNNKNVVVSRVEKYYFVF